MKRRSFTPTRAILVILLIGGLYKVGTVVNPPPAGPPAPIKAAPASDQTAQRTQSHADMTKEMTARMEKQVMQAKLAREKEAMERKANGGKLLDKDDGISPVYFQQTQMGTAGFAETEKKEAHKKEVTDLVNKEFTAKMGAEAAAAGKGPKPAGSPVASPAIMPNAALPPTNK